jgi:hypothetical protein
MMLPVGSSGPLLRVGKRTAPLDPVNRLANPWSAPRWCCPGRSSWFEYALLASLAIVIALVSLAALGSNASLAHQIHVSGGVICYQ